ncbi:type II toxin-antitoxin system Phd/YefM family antitoxin [Collinsella aerofaciens]|uniref:type II toxin-antitoxin system Phd/YefM family antitoxin n=1 Tax=Collinsella aerofaciens TaxID=74426 RepID=UPI00374E208C
MILCKEFHMPVVKPISDLQRNSGAIADSCHKTKEPVYLTKNGSASLVVMDAEAYDEQTRANYHSGTRRSHSTYHRSWLRRPHQRPRASLEAGEGRGGSDASHQVRSPLPHVTIL